MMDWDNIQITVLHDDGVVVQDEYSYSLRSEQRMIIFGGEQGPQGPAGPQGPQGPAGSGAEWGGITGTLTDQTDLVNALNAKANSADLGALADHDTVDYGTEVTNKPALGTMAEEDKDDYYDKSSADALLAGKADSADLGTMAAVNDAPSDGSEYVRKNGAWSVSSGGGGGSAAWGDITGTLSDQTDLQDALDDKQDALSIDSVPTENSTAVVESGGVYAALVKSFRDVYKVTLPNASSSKKSFTAQGITSSHEMVVEGWAYLSNPAAVASDLNITTGTNSITITGTLTDTTNIIVTFGIPRTITAS